MRMNLVLKCLNQNGLNSKSADENELSSNISHSEWIKFEKMSMRMNSYSYDESIRDNKSAVAVVIK